MTPFFKPILAFLAAVLVGALVMVSTGHAYGKFESPVNSAEVITLGTVTCGTLKQCVAIPNDAGADVNIYGAPQYPYFYVLLDGTYYYAPVASGYVIDNVEAQSFILADPTNPAQRTFTGQLITINGTFTSYRTCTHSGRGQYCLTHWAFVGGSIMR